MLYKSFEPQIVKRLSYYFNLGVDHTAPANVTSKLGILSTTASTKQQNENYETVQRSVKIPMKLDWTRKPT